MTFSFMFVSSLQFGGLEQPRHLPKRSPASAAGAPLLPTWHWGLGASSSAGGDRAGWGSCSNLFAVSLHNAWVLLCFFFFLFSLIVGAVYEAVCQKTIDSREPAYTKRVCRSSEAMKPWKPPPFAFAQVKPKLCGWLVKSAEICKEVKHVHASVH